jgi:hypothetical protein
MNLAPSREIQIDQEKPHGCCKGIHQGEHGQSPHHGRHRVLAMYPGLHDYLLLSSHDSLVATEPDDCTKSW